MAVNVSPFGPKPQFLLATGVPAVGNQIFFYVAGSVNTKQNTYTTSAGSVANANPIVLNALGEPSTEIWFTAGQTYKVVYAPSTDTDPPTSPIWTIDNLSGINDTTVSQSEWSSGPTPTFISTTSFSLVGDQTSNFTVGRRVKTTNTGGTSYSTITTSAFTTVTTVTVVNDSSGIDSGLSAVFYGLLNPAHPSIDITTVNNTTSSDGQYLARSSTAVQGSVYIDNPGRPNLLINPNWQIDQINEGTLYTVNTTAVNGPDGWSGDAVGTGVFKLRTLADPENAALKCLEITCTTADAAIAATDTYSIFTAVEGYDATSLMAGTSSAGTITIQFKFKTNVTGVYGVAIANSAKNRSYYGIITVADTSEHEYSMSLTMDTTGTWLYTNGVGLYLRLTLSAGSNFQGTAGTWAGDAKTTTSAQCNFMSANTNIAYLKRIQIIPGALVQAYRPADLQKELAKAQRYLYKTFAQGTAAAQNVGVNSGEFQFMAVVAAGGGTSRGNLRFPVVMRAAPTLTLYNPAATNAQARDISLGTDCSSTTGTTNLSGDGVTIATIGAGSSVAQSQLAVHVSANARLT